MSDEVIKGIITESTLDEIGDAIRSKNGEVNKYYPSEMPAKIRAIPQEGGAIYTPGEGIDITDFVISVKQALLNTINGKSTVSIDPTLVTGTKIADIEIDGTTYSIYAPSGGAGDLEDLGDVVITSAQNGDVLKYDSQTGKWVNAVESGGTEVIANPTGTPTDTLNTIEIDGTIYEIVGGGGSGDAYERTVLATPNQSVAGEITLSDDIDNYDELEIVVGFTGGNSKSTFRVDTDYFMTEFPYVAGATSYDTHYLCCIYANYYLRMTMGSANNKLYAFEQSSLMVEEVAGIKHIGGGSGGASAVSDLTDVDLTNLADGQVLKWNVTSQKWENANESGGSSLPFDVEINSTDNGIDIVFDDGT